MVACESKGRGREEDEEIRKRREGWRDCGKLKIKSTDEAVSEVRSLCFHFLRAILP